MEWAHHVCAAHIKAKETQNSVTHAQLHTADLLAPRGNNIFSAGDPNFVVEDLTPTIETDVIPELLESVAAPKGVRFVAAKVRKITEWRHFFRLHARTEIKDQSKLLTHSRHGSVTVLHSDTPLGRRSSPTMARTTIRRITGAQCLGRHRLTSI